MEVEKSLAEASTSQTSTPRKVAKLKKSEDDEIIDSIDAAYYTLNEEFDAIDYELKVKINENDFLTWKKDLEAVRH